MKRYEPAGSYLETSYDITVVLTCESQKIDGEWIRTGLQIQDLCGGLVNLNGQLKPEHDSEPSTGYIPPGSYKDSCRDIRITLHATCQKRDQSWVPSSLDITKYQTYPGTLVNDNGDLAFNMR